MEENYENQPEEIQNDQVEENPDINLDDDYVINWDASENTEDDAIQIGETEEVSLGERTSDSEEVDGSLRVDASEGEDVDEGESQEERDLGVELGQIDEDYDEDDQPEYEDDDEEDYYDDEEEGESKYGEEWDGLFKFLEDHPGATIEDYMSVNQSYDDLSDEDVLKIDLAAEHGLDVEDDAEELDFLLRRYIRIRRRTRCGERHKIKKDRCQKGSTRS